MRLLNFVLPLIFGIGLLLGTDVYGGAGKLLTVAGISEPTSLALGGWIALLIVFGSAFAIVKCKVNLRAPLSKKAAIGHAILAIGNVAAVATALGPMAVAYLSGRSDYGLYTWFALPVFIVNMILWPLGWMLAVSKEGPNSKDVRA